MPKHASRGPAGDPGTMGGIPATAVPGNGPASNRGEHAPGPRDRSPGAETRALVVVAHGSRRPASNREVQALASRLPAGRDFARVETGFLELAEPSIPAAIERCIDAGATEIVIVPYFLAAGRHVAVDIPAIVAPMMQRFPHVGMHLAPHIGASRALACLVVDAARNAAGCDADTVTLRPSA